MFINLLKTVPSTFLYGSKIRWPFVFIQIYELLSQTIVRQLDFKDFTSNHFTQTSLMMWKSISVQSVKYYIPIGTLFKMMKICEACLKSY